MTKFVEYHSMEWMILVETNWITWTVDSNIAKMIYVGPRGY